MDAMQALLIEQQCRRLIHRYAYLNDERDFDALIDLFTDDAILYRPSAPTTPLPGRDTGSVSQQARRCAHLPPVQRRHRRCR